MSSATIVIIGASFAGLSIAQSLLKEIPSVKVILINPSSKFYFVIAAPRILAKLNAFRSDQYLLPIEEAFAAYDKDSLEFILGSVTSIDPDAKTVTVNKETNIPFDYLVIASGSTSQSMAGGTGDLIPFKTTNSDNVEDVIERAQQKIAKAVKVVIGGAGPVGVETAAEIAEAAAERGADVDITLVCATDRVLPMLKPNASRSAEDQLREKKIHVIKSRRVKKATRSHDDGSKWTVSLDNGESLDADLYISAVGIVPNNDFIPRQFLDSDGWVIVDKELRVNTDKGSKLPIFAAGDITNNSMRLAFKIKQQAPVVTANLKAEITGEGKTLTYDQGTTTLMIVPIGASGGTGQLYGWVPWRTVVWILKGRDFLISKAQSLVAAG